MNDAVASARHIADDLLFPDAVRVDGMDKLPRGHIDALAAAGLYGSVAPDGLALQDREMFAVAEELASGCLATAFTWIQHLGLLATLAFGTEPAALRTSWLPAAIKGTLRGGIALTGQIPGPPLLRAEPVADGWRLDGFAPWVSGWDGLVNVVVIAARGPGDTIVRLIMDAAAAPGLTVTREHLIAANASVTVRLDFDAVGIAAGRLVSQEPFDPARGNDLRSLRMNGSLALGVTSRCCRLLGPGPLDDELDACRTGLDDAADVGAMARARAAASELAVRASAALAVHEGSKAVVPGQHAQRLSREALFLLVFGSRPPIKAALMHRLAGHNSSGSSPVTP
ncbi:MAG TPA: acyl-CoA dehydrogenase family protein [Streptosporangiaceae bacterium]